MQKIWADQGFAGRLVEWSRTILGRELEIVRKAPGRRGFQIQPKKRAIERTFSWLTAHHRLAREQSQRQDLRAPDATDCQSPWRSAACGAVAVHGAMSAAATETVARRQKSGP